MSQSESCEKESTTTEVKIPKILPNRKPEHASETGGVQPMWLEGRLHYERERLIGMTDEERRWRARFLNSLKLAPEEPVTPPNYYREYYNPIRRLYKIPMNAVENSLASVIGRGPAVFLRGCLYKTGMIIMGIYVGWYYLKYNTQDWTRRGGWRVFRTREVVYPGSKDFPNYNIRSKRNQFAVNGFDKSPI